MKFFLASFILLFAIQINPVNAQVLETEDSRPLNKGQLELGAGYEYQTSKEGYEAALPLSFEYGLSKRFTFLLEPVPFTIIHPKAGRHVTGFGDLEMTLFYQVLKENKKFPSISISAEVKLPTAKDSLIGTGKTDFTPFLIVSKESGKFLRAQTSVILFLESRKASSQTIFLIMH